MKVSERVFVEKKEGFQVEAKDLFAQLKENFHIQPSSMRLVNVYDVFNIEKDILEKAKATVFSEPVVDVVLEDVEASGMNVIAIETLPGQYDQRADSAMQCVKLLDPTDSCVITSGKLLIFDCDLSEEEYEKVSHYVINPIETRKKNMDVLSIDSNVDVKPLKDYSGFIDMNDQQIEAFLKEEGLAMSKEDLLMVQDYFKNTEKRDPSETEIRVLDTYWSDHCRHTTFETCLKDIKITTSRFKEDIQTALDRYMELRKENGRCEKPITLMDMATINARDLRNKKMADEVEVSEEINACSVFIDVDHDGVMEKWLLQFKNETHNHPTEIEPFGGASTCIGGAIRDPLSGRSYVYQAMRISGSGNVLESIEKTMEGKLPQKVISKKAAQGNSSYGNQIGLPTTFVREIYHDSYVAKHMEVGAVVGASKVENVRRETPVNKDVVILLGGRTGRDGIGGATGSSKEHNVKSLEVCASEVQKGNAPEERKIQRLFRNEACTKLIKKCNDFGAGGVCVAIGELASGLKINLDLVRTKYAGLNATEIAISESQERMAVVVAADDADRFISMAEAENLEAYVVAVVNDSNRLVMEYHGEVVVDLARDFIDTSGARQHADVNIDTLSGKNPFRSELECNEENICHILSDMNVASQKGLAEMFDASIGSTTVLMPFGGKTQLTPAQASVQKLPVLDGRTKTCSILTYGFDPEVMEYSCFVGAQNSVLQSMAKVIAVGGKMEHIHFSFQEYFERLGKNERSWGKVTEALLGAIAVQDKFKIAAIGGKDSMSGTFQDISVVPTLISFACAHGDVDNIISNELKGKGHVLSLVAPVFDFEKFDLDSVQKTFEEMERLIQSKKVLACSVIEKGGAAATLFKMAFGNMIGFDVKLKHVFDFMPACFIVESEEALDSEYAVIIGHTSDKVRINGIEVDMDKAAEAYMSTFEKLYPTVSQSSKALIPYHDTVSKQVFKSRHLVDEVHVCIPVFPGTNCEYDTARAFEEEGAITHIFVFRNETEQMIFDSIDELVELLGQCQILAFPGGFSSGDEPDGSAKFIVNVLQNEKVKKAVHDLLDRDGLILGICNGFQALVKSGLLPYGRIRTLDESAPTLFRNDINRHISTIVHTRVASNHSPWLAHEQVGDVYSIAVSHGEGKFVVSEELAEELFEKGCVAFQYCDDEGRLSYDSHSNVNGSCYAIEGITSFDGHILGKMGHSERYFNDVFKNIPGKKKQSIFASGVQYFKK